MCGIAGYAGRNPPDAAVLRRMCDALVHRGPDQDGYLVAGSVAFGMRRLSIIGVGSGRQPIYNEHGERCVDHLRGMFAFALWDERQQRLLLARDRVGKKPLLYRATPEGIWFASELKALLLGGTMPRAVDPLALHSYLTYGYVPAPQSIVAGVRKLPAAHTLSWRNGIAEERRYWRLRYEPKQKLSEAEAVEGVRDLIREATRIRLVSERPLGAFLSGGIDSSLVVAAMAEATS